MRCCQDCSKPDAVFWERNPCSCGAAKPHDQPDVAIHAPDCRAIGHEVVFYPVRIERSDLWYDASGDPHLPALWSGRGWVLKPNGAKFYRVKLLCRDCIQKLVEIRERQKEYEGACKTARGIDDQTYAQMLASQ